MHSEYGDRKLKEKSVIPRRPLGSLYGDTRLHESVSIIGLGCSSFSTFFWREEECADEAFQWDAGSIEKKHPRIQKWLECIEYAVMEAGISLVDTAPWYGHGTSEVVIGWALEELITNHASFRRKDLMINTKVGRYEAEPSKQFDFSAKATLASVERSLKRMKCGYIDVLQLHDPEFSPSLEQLLAETIPAMIECQQKGWCRALGMTGYPLEIQHQILEACWSRFGRKVFNQSLTYGHYNLHDTSLFDKRIGNGNDSYVDYCRGRQLVVLAAAPLSMGLLTHRGPPEWHPASSELKIACRASAETCATQGVNLSTLALTFALSNPDIPCTILGMSEVEEVKTAVEVSRRFHNLPQGLEQQALLKIAFNEFEFKAFTALANKTDGPFAAVKKVGLCAWDGVKEARNFWKQLSETHTFEDWHCAR